MRSAGQSATMHVADSHDPMCASDSRRIRLRRLVVDTDEKQSVRRRGLAGFAAIAGGEHFGGPVDVALAGADFDQRADDRADHVVEEAVAGDVDGDAVGVTRSCSRAHDSVRESCGSSRAVRSRRFRSWRSRGGRRAPALPCASRRRRAAADSARRSGESKTDGERDVVDVVAIALADGVVGGVEVFAGVFDRDARRCRPAAAR